MVLLCKCLFDRPAGSATMVTQARANTHSNHELACRSIPAVYIRESVDSLCRDSADTHYIQYLGGEWSRPFCSRPWVGSSKGSNLWSCEDQKEYSPEDQYF